MSSLHATPTAVPVEAIRHDGVAKARNLRERMQEHLYGELSPSLFGIKVSQPEIATLGFYSDLERALEAGPARAEPAQWLGFIGGLTRRGVKPEEIARSGLEALLHEKPENEKISRSHLVEHAAKAGVSIMESQLFANAQAAYDRSGALGGVNARYADYVLAGATGYREVILALANGDAFAEERAARKFYREAVDAKVPLDEQSRLRAKLDAATGRVAPDRQFKSMHWSERANVIAHARLNDRVDADAKRVLFVEEIQSDWGAAIKNTGGRNETRLSLAQASAQAALRALREFVCRRDEGLLIEASIAVAIEDVRRHVTGAAHIHELTSAPDLEDEARALVDAADLAADALKRAMSADEVPHGPFVGQTNEWLSLILKRVIRIAVDGAYDRVSFITGDQSAQRFALDKNAADGGAGLRLFYDTIVPNAVRSLVKKLDRDGDGLTTSTFNSPFEAERCSRTGLWNVVDGEGSTVHGRCKSRGDAVDWIDSHAPEMHQPGFDVTPALRATALRGLPLFGECLDRQSPSQPDFRRRVNVSLMAQHMDSYAQGARTRESETGFYRERAR